jgi:hypothetical protein
MSESAFFPLVIYYLTTFYRRGELARRLAIFYAASNIASEYIQNKNFQLDARLNFLN